MSDILDQVFEVLKTRKGADAGSSYVASLYQKGTAHICEKVREETEEAIAEAMNGDADRLKEESADLLFHLMVLLADQGLSLDDVRAVLERRFGTSGHEEKANRVT